jgi:hypothetical protein
MIANDVTAWEIIYAVLRVRFLWPLYGLLYLCVGMGLKMRWVECRTREGFANASVRPELVRQTYYPALPVPLRGEDHDLRIENSLTDEHGDEVKLEKGAHVEVTVTAEGPWVTINPKAVP